jgi:hypothetical protein
MKMVSPVFGLEAKVKFVEGSQSKNAGASAGGTRVPVHMYLLL